VKGKRKCSITIEHGKANPCAVSPNYPGRTPAETSCEIDLGKKTKFVRLYGKSEQWFDYLTISGKRYSGLLSGDVKASNTIKWTSDFWLETKTGWKICKSKKPPLKVLESAREKHLRLVRAAQKRRLKAAKAAAEAKKRAKILAEKKKENGRWLVRKPRKNDGKKRQQPHEEKKLQLKQSGRGGVPGWHAGIPQKSSLVPVAPTPDA